MSHARLVMSFLFVTLAAIAGCGDNSDSKSKTTGGKESDFDKLAALGYAGGTEGDESGVEENNKAKVYPGYTLYSLHMKAMAQLIDEDGKVIHEWSDPDGRHWDNIELLPNGDLITTGADPTPPGMTGIYDDARYAMRLDWDGNVIWKRYMYAHHDITKHPTRDEFLVLAFQRREEDSISKDIELRDDMLVRLDMNGEVIDKISMYDTVAKTPELYPYQDREPTVMGGKTWIDHFHLNAVEWMSRPELAKKDPIYALTNVLFCSRHQSLIAIINMETKELLWTWGRTDVPGFPKDAEPLDGPHDATMLDNGHIMVFDNGLSRGWSRIVEIDPLSRQVVWQWFDEKDKKKAERAGDNLSKRTDEADRRFYTKSKGSNQRLPNGNTLICNSDNGELFEVSPSGEVVWRYLASERVSEHGKNLRAAFVRGYRYEKDFIDKLMKAHAKDKKSDAADAGDNDQGSSDNEDGSD